MVTDITDLIDEDGLPVEGPGGKLAWYLGTIVSTASITPVNIWIDAAIRCRRRPNHRPCAGHIRLRRTGLSSPVEWGCTWCDESGAISNWKGSFWDLSICEIQDEVSDNQQRFEIVLTQEELIALRQNLTFDLDSELVLARAQTIAKGCLIRATAAELDNLVEYIIEVAGYEKNKRQKRLLNQARDRIEALLKR